MRSRRGAGCASRAHSPSSDSSHSPRGPSSHSPLSYSCGGAAATAPHQHVATLRRLLAGPSAERGLPPAQALFEADGIPPVPKLLELYHKGVPLAAAWLSKLHLGSPASQHPPSPVPPLASPSPLPPQPMSPSSPPPSQASLSPPPPSPPPWPPQPRQPPPAPAPTSTSVPVTTSPVITHDMTMDGGRFSAGAARRRHVAQQIAQRVASTLATSMPTANTPSGTPRGSPSGSPARPPPATAAPSLAFTSTPPTSFALKGGRGHQCGQCNEECRIELSLGFLAARLQAERTVGENTRFTVDTLARELLAQGKHDEAESLFREALAIDRETLRGRHPGTFASLNNFGGLMYAKGDLATAESLFREALAVERETLGNRHLSTLMSIEYLGKVLEANGDLAAAEPLLRKALVGRREAVADQDPDTLITINNLSGLLYAKGDPGAAEAMLRLALELGAARDPRRFASKHAQYHRQPRRRPGVVGSGRL